MTINTSKLRTRSHTHGRTCTHALTLSFSRARTHTTHSQIRSIAGGQWREKRCLCQGRARFWKRKANIPTILLMLGKYNFTYTHTRAHTHAQTTIYKHRHSHARSNYFFPRIYLFMCLCMYLSIYLSIYLSMYLSICLSVILSMSLFIYSNFHRYVYVHIYMFIHM